MRQQLELQLVKVSEKLSQVDWGRSQVYGDFLAQTYYFVSHSTRLLALAASRFSVSQDQLFRRFVEHLGEEKNHEKMALNDLQNLGFSLSQFPERSETRAFYETQYYKIEFQDPIALLGYIMILEAVAVQFGPQVYRSVSQHYGPKSTHFLKVHVEEDPEHIDKVLQLVTQFDLPRLKLIQLNLEQSTEIYGHMLMALGHGKAMSSQPSSAKKAA